MRNKLLKVECGSCGKAFESYKTAAGIPKFCSRNCYYSSRVGVSKTKAQIKKQVATRKKTMALKKIPEIERFEKFFEKTEGCWLWKGGLLYAGYGAFTRDGNKSVRAHRYSYEVYVGKIPDGLVLDHLCRVRNCINPAHLEAVTQAVNSFRTRKNACINGHEFVVGSYYVSSRGRRACKQCTKDRGARRYRRLKNSEENK